MRIEWTTTKDGLRESEAFVTLYKTRYYLRAGSQHGHLVVIPEGVTVSFSQAVSDATRMKRTVERALQDAIPQMRALEKAKRDLGHALHASAASHSIRELSAA